MTEQMRDSERELIAIHSREAAEVAALVREMRATVARLGHEAMEMRQEVARLKTAAARTAAAAGPSSGPRLPDAIPGAPH
ncbi:hypothetical protein SSP24_64160 [Streptomyces spinoverrucosus]|uniref:Uncharacterized protein n=1 Tax=Streptomyces spinoverrucosus TaxID=284043 RepID=A0A4Y3VSJ4_9ACTN|nr:hypothetical protein SSP24_64160 [Streptomyces spinoverrucosus]GHB63998.1 hypothetical protein GCM10010397_37650 [Streptomyces spinoverrucosus]